MPQAVTLDHSASWYNFSSKLANKCNFTIFKWLSCSSLNTTFSIIKKWEVLLYSIVVNYKVIKKNTYSQSPVSFNSKLALQLARRCSCYVVAHEQRHQIYTNYVFCLDLYQSLVWVSLLALKKWSTFRQHWSEWIRKLALSLLSLSFPSFLCGCHYSRNNPLHQNLKNIDPQQPDSVV